MCHCVVVNLYTYVTSVHCSGLKYQVKKKLCSRKGKNEKETKKKPNQKQQNGNLILIFVNLFDMTLFLETRKPIM